MNDLVNGACKEFTLIFARGTDGAGNIGGPGQNLADALINKLGADKVAVQGVSAPAYPATWTSAESSTLQAPGAAEMARLANQAMTKCPSTKLVLSGYSQGAMVSHLAASDITRQYPTVIKFISSVVLFGDPNRGIGFGSLTTDNSSRMLNICHNAGAAYPYTDLYCTHTNPNPYTGGEGHTTYGNAADMALAVSHVLQHAGGGGS